MNRYLTRVLAALQDPFDPIAHATNALCSPRLNCAYRLLFRLAQARA